MITGRTRTAHSKSAVAALMAVLASSCVQIDDRGAGSEPTQDPGAAGSAALPESALDYHDIEMPPGHVEHDYEGAIFPLAEDDPRAQFEIDVDTLLPDGTFEPLPLQGDDVLKTVIPPIDSRARVTNTRVLPASTSVLVLATFPNYTKLCSGTMVGPDAVLTGGHCVFDVNTQRWATSVRCAPGAYPNGAGSYTAPFGSSSGRRLCAHDNYRTRPAPERYGYDFGMVRLNSALGNSSGTRVVGSAAAPAGNIEYYGYQGDLIAYQMYKAPGRVLGWEYQQYTVFKHDADCQHGASGSGVASSGNTTTVFGVLTSQLPDRNLAISFDIAKRDRVRSWISMAL